MVVEFLLTEAFCLRIGSVFYFVVSRVLSDHQETNGFPHNENQITRLPVSMRSGIFFVLVKLFLSSFFFFEDVFWTSLHLISDLFVEGMVPVVNL